MNNIFFIIPQRKGNLGFLSNLPVPIGTVINQFHKNPY